MSRSPQPPRYMKGKRRAEGGWYARTRVGGVEVSLGTWGTPESHRAYQRILAEWTSSTQAQGAPPLRVGAVLTIRELCVRFLVHAEARYRKPDGSQTGEAKSYGDALQPLRRLYGDTAAVDFGPRQLEAVRQAMLDGSWLEESEKKMGRRKGKAGWCRRVVNAQVRRIRHVFKWGAGQLGLSVTVHQALQCVEPLRAGMPGTREAPAIKPVPETILRATLPALGPVVRAMVELQLLTGARPGEVCALRPADLDRCGKVWVYRPSAHKTAHHGHERFILLGPQAQAVLLPFLDRAPDAHCFSPQDTAQAHAADRRKNRKTKVQPSQAARQAKPGGQRRPRVRYTQDSYGRAVARACSRAQVPPWHPNQLRHNAATRLSAEFGWDVARIILGHRTLAATRIYAEDAIAKASEVVAKVG